MSNKIVLVMPKYARPVRYSGLGYLAASLHNQGFMAKCKPNFTHQKKDSVSVEPFDVTVLDLSLAPSDFSLADYLTQVQPLVVGSTAFNLNYKDALAVAVTAKKACPQALRVIGGWSASPQSNKVLRESSFDLVIRNEGEETLVELAVLAREVGPRDLGQYLPQIQGITFRSSKGNIIENPTHLPRLGLDGYPFLPEALDLYHFTGYPEEQTKVGKVAYLNGSRGCVFSCIYCANPAIYTTNIRYRSPANVLEEIRLYYALGYRHFSFRDEIFTANPGRTREIIDGIKALQSEGIYIKWFCQTRADLLDEEMIIAMKGSGLVQLIFGIESGDQDVVDYLKNNHVSLASCSKNIQTAKANDIATINYYIFGGPKQTWQSMFKSLLFMMRNRPFLVSTQIIKDYPGNKTAGIPRAVTKEEALLAKALFDNVFFSHPIEQLDPEQFARAPLTKVYSNAYRFATMVDLFIRSMEGYTDKDRENFLTNRIAHLLHRSQVNDENNFLSNYFTLLALMEKGVLQDVQLDESNMLSSNPKGFLVKLLAPCLSLKDIVELGIHPKVADAYFDDFLASIKLANVQNTLLKLSVANFAKFFLFMSILWGVMRENGLPVPEIVELDVDKRENNKLFSEILGKTTVTDISLAANSVSTDSLVQTLTMDLYGLPIVVDIAARKIIVKMSAYVPSDKIELSGN